MMGEMFSTRAEFVHAMESNAHNHGLNILKSDTFSDFVSQILTNLSWLLYNVDLIFYLGLLCLGILLILRPAPLRLPLACGTIAYGLFTMLWGSDIARLFGVNYGVVVLLITITVAYVYDQLTSLSLQRFLYVFIIVSLFGTFLQQKYIYLRSPNIQWFGGIYLSEPARREWLSERNIFSRDLFHMRDWIHENLPNDEELYGYRTGYLFYFQRKYIVSGAHFGEQLDRWLEKGASYTARTTPAV